MFDSINDVVVLCHICILWKTFCVSDEDSSFSPCSVTKLRLSRFHFSGHAGLRSCDKARAD